MNSNSKPDNNPNTAPKQRKLTSNLPNKAHQLTAHSYEEGDQNHIYHQNDDASTDYDYKEKPHLPIKVYNETNTKYKTELCTNWMLSGKCKFGRKCSYAHGESELKLRHDLPHNYKTKECKNFSRDGYCMYGSRCQFIHKGENSLAISYNNLLNENARSIELMLYKNMNFDLRYVNLGVNKSLRVFEALR